MNRWRYFSKYERAIISIALAQFALSKPPFTEDNELAFRGLQDELSREQRAEPQTVAEAREKGRADYMRVTGQSK